MNKNDGIIMFKDTFEYIVNGELTPEESVLLMKLIYDFKWLDICPEDKDISSKSVRLIWKTLKHTINRSKQNQRAYNKKTDKDMHIADITPNGEFEYTEQGEQFAPKRQTRPVEQPSIAVQPQQQEMRSYKQPDNSYCDPPHKPGWLPSYEHVARKLNQNRQYSTV